MASIHKTPKNDSPEQGTTFEGVNNCQASTLDHHVNTLGSVRLQDVHTKERILVPSPSDDPNDPLNWSKPFRYYLALLVCLAMVMCNFLAAGPSIAIVETTTEFFGAFGPDSTSNVAKTAYFYTSTSLLQGLGNLVWMPLIVKYGRRPIYLLSFTLYTATAIWVGLAKSYANALVARIVLGFAAGSAECLAPLTISDIFFLHERGTVMAAYTASLNFGVSIGIIVSGLITYNLGYRHIYYVATALIGFLTIVVFSSMPETSYKRCGSATAAAAAAGEGVTTATTTDASDSETATIANTDESGTETTASSHHQPPARTSLPPPAKKRSYFSGLKIYSGLTFTTEPFWLLFLRPITLLLLPPVLWATLVMSVTIGFLVAITSNFASAFSTVYAFESWQSGLCFVAGFIGSAVGIFFGGWFSDWTAEYFTRRNEGVREPEFRLPAIAVGLVTAPLALVLYGVGIERGWHWLVPTLGLGLINFSIAQATNVSLVYIVDAYRPIAGETVVTQLGFKSAFGFLLSFYTNPWIEQAGYQNAFGAMAGITTAVLVAWIPFFVWGKRIRRESLRWPVVRRAVVWGLDREVGE